MKKLTTRFMLATAALLVAAGAASAQTMRAAIPFEFHAGNRVMAPGTYSVDLSYLGGTPIFRLLNVESGGSIALLPQAPVDAQKTWIASGSGELVFECTNGNCVLAELYNGSGSRAYTVWRPKLSGGETAVLREIPMQRGKGE